VPGLSTILHEIGVKALLKMYFQKVVLQRVSRSLAIERTLLYVVKFQNCKILIPQKWPKKPVFTLFFIYLQ